MFNLDMSESSLGVRKAKSALAFAEVQSLSPRRICFATTHVNALRKSEGKFAWSLKLPFRGTIGPLLAEDLGLPLFQSKFLDHVYSGLDGFEHARVADWIARRPDTVFIRDLMDLSAALSVHIGGENQRTP